MLYYRDVVYLLFKTLFMSQTSRISILEKLIADLKIENAKLKQQINTNKISIKPTVI